MKRTNSLVYVALIARIISLFCLGVFYYSLSTGLADRAAILSLGLSFSAWLTGSFFLGAAYDVQGSMEAVTESQPEEEVNEDEEDKQASHPMFDE